MIPIEKALHMAKQVKRWNVQGGACTPHFIAAPLYGTTTTLEEAVPGCGYKIGFMIFEEEGEKSYWCSDLDFSIEQAEILSNEPKKLQAAYEEWLRREKALYDYLETLDTENIPLHEYSAFYKKYLYEFGLGITVDYFLPWGDQLVEEMFKKYPQHKEIIQELIKPFSKSFISEEELSELKIRKAIEEGKEQEEELQKHQKKYYWVENNYKYTKVLSTKDFLKRIKEHTLTPEKIKQRIEELENYDNKWKEQEQKAKELFPENYEKLKILSLTTYWQDRRKKINLIADHYLKLFLKKASKEYIILYLELQFMLPKEFEQLIQTKNYNQEEIQQRLKGCTIMVSIDKGTELYSGEEHAQLTKIILDKKIAHTEDLRGLCASSGIAQGNVRIITNPAKDHFEKGEILVTSMTRPEFVTIMKKAAAIVTDEGGITSHAAVISRELGIPCIVGTKYATEIFKDGDEVTINANHGVIRKVKK